MSKSHPVREATVPVSDAQLSGRVNVARSGAIMAAGTLVSCGLSLTRVALIVVAIGALGPLSSEPRVPTRMAMNSPTTTMTVRRIPDRWMAALKARSPGMDAMGSFMGKAVSRGPWMQPVG